jgi:hypothetical protein
LKSASSYGRFLNKRFIAAHASGKPIKNVFFETIKFDISMMKKACAVVVIVKVALDKFITIFGRLVKAHKTIR